MRPYPWIAGLLSLTLSACAEKGPGKAELIARGDELVARDKAAQAAAPYRNAVRIDGRDGPLRVKLANAYLAAGNFKGAADEAVRASDLLPDDAEVQLFAARLMLLQLRFTDVKDRMAAFLQRNPDNVRGMVYRANAIARLQDSTWALFSLPAAMRSGLGFEGPRRDLRPPTSTTEDADAEAILRQALKLAPDDPEAQWSLANLLWATGRPDDAESILRRAADQSPQQAAVNEALGSYYIARGRDADAEKYLKAAGTNEQFGRGARFALADLYMSRRRLAEARTVLRAMPASDDETGGVALRRASVEFLSGERAEASTQIDALLARRPNDSAAQLLKARLAAAAQEWDQALTLAREVITREPKSSWAHAVIADALAARGETTAAYEEAAEAFRLDPASAEMSLRLARLAVAVGRGPEALQAARNAKRLDPGNPEAALTLAKALILGRDYVAADLELRPLAARANPGSDVLAQVGIIKEARGDREGARASYARALQADPASLVALSGMVSLDLKDGSIPRARQLVDRAVGMRPRDPTCLLLAARVYVAAREPARVEQLLRTVLEIEPGRADAATLLAEVLAGQGRMADARRVLESLLERTPASLDAQVALASLFEREGNTVEALAHYERIVAANPRAAAVASKLARLYVDLGRNLDVALSLATQGKQGRPRDADAADALGWVYMKKNLPAFAIAQLQTAVRIAPDNPLYRYHLGSAFLAAGNGRRAREELTRALALDPKFQHAEQARAALASLK